MDNEDIPIWLQAVGVAVLVWVVGLVLAQIIIGVTP
jgi:hypothetical protein